MKHSRRLSVFAAITLTIFIFLGITISINPTWLNAFDNYITNVVRLPYPSMTSYYRFFTQFANPPVIAGIFLIILIYLLTKKQNNATIWLSLSTIGMGTIINPLIKLIFKRERPTLEHLVTEHSFSFPSGHANSSMVFYGTLFLLAFTFIQRKKIRILFQLFLGFLIITIGISRIYLGVHFPSDILGGYCLGLTWLLISYPIYKQKQHNWTLTERRNKNDF